MQGWLSTHATARCGGEVTELDGDVVVGGVVVAEHVPGLDLQATLGGLCSGRVLACEQAAGEAALYEQTPTPMGVDCPASSAVVSQECVGAPSMHAFPQATRA
jgi:hypothetical protein